jgi:hypothetical protein
MPLMRVRIVGQDSRFASSGYLAIGVLGKSGYPKSEAMFSRKLC